MLVGFLDEKWPTFNDFELIVASPTHLEPGTGRQYDHTRDVVLAAADEAEGRWPFDTENPPAIVKTAVTPRLVRLTHRERREIVEGPLRASLHVPDPSVIRGRGILVYDNGFTDGSTLDEVARCLRLAGATHVCGVSLTRQPWRGG